MDRTTAANYATIDGLRAFQNADPGAGISVGTGVSGVDLQAHQEEIMAVIEGAGLTGNAGNLKQLLQGFYALAFKNVTVFLASGTFTVPANVTVVSAEVWGAGAGSFAGYSSASYASGGGGGGGYARKIVSGLTPGGTVAVTVGAGGLAGTTSAYPTAGGTSSFGAYLSATGGMLNGSATLASPCASGLAGSGSGGDINFTGSWGFTAAPSINGAGNIGGNGGAGAFGGGGASGNVGIAQDGGFPGGGGGGVGPDEPAGSQGGFGLVVVRW